MDRIANSYVATVVRNRRGMREGTVIPDNAHLTRDEAEVVFKPGSFTMPLTLVSAEMMFENPALLKETAN